MRLIDMDDLLRNLQENAQEYIRIDKWQTFFAVIKAIGEQKPLLRHALPTEFVIAPCPLCGSAEVVIDISKKQIGIHELCRGRFTCLSCKQEYGVYAERVQDVYRKWNNDFPKLCKELQQNEEWGNEKDETD